MNQEKSIQAFKDAQKVIPGGVNSPVRAFKSVNCSPIFIAEAKGSKVKDIDGNEYVDCVSSWGPLICGHSHPDVLKAINDTAAKGTSYGAPTLIETEMAERIVAMIPSIKKVRMVNSGTEATMSAIRLARGYTGRECIIKFAGNYHGHGDSFLIKAGSGAITLGLPDSPGVTKHTAADTLIADFNNLESVEKLLIERTEEVAAIIVEPVAGNMGVIPPNPGFLEGLRTLCDKYGSLLIFDEVITGFRLARGGAQEYYNVMPDLTTLGKIIGGGLPVGAYGGSAEIMDHLAPNGPVYQAGTLSGNPLAMAAGLVILKKMDKQFYTDLNSRAEKLEAGFKKNAKETGTNAVFNRVGSMMTMFFTDNKKVEVYEDAMISDTAKYANYFSEMVEQGVYIAPSQFECLFASMAHSEQDINTIITAHKKALENIK